MIYLGIITCSFIILLYATFSVWRPRYAFARKFSATAATEEEATEEKVTRSQDLPPLSVIVISADEGARLEYTLRQILCQDYPNLEVIAVDAASEDNTADIITRLQGEYRNLRRSHVPHTAQQIDRINLSLLLGIRAAHYEWVVLTRPTGAPASNQWLRLMMSTTINEGSKATEGYTAYETDFDPGNHEQLAIRHYRQSEAERLTGLYMGKTCNTPATNLLIYRDEAIKLIDNQHLITLGGSLATSLCLNPKAWVKGDTTYFSPESQLNEMAAATNISPWSQRTERWSAVLIYILVSTYGIVRLIQYLCQTYSTQTGTWIDDTLSEAQNLCANTPFLWCGEPMIWMCDSVIITILLAKFVLTWHSRHRAMQTIESI